jgi:phenylalanine-4-hydroxylase
MLAPPPGCAGDWTLAQGWGDDTPAEHTTGVTLSERQMKVLQDRACP